MDQILFTYITLEPKTILIYFCKLYTSVTSGIILCYFIIQLLTIVGFKRWIHNFAITNLTKLEHIGFSLFVILPASVSNLLYVGILTGNNTVSRIQLIIFGGVLFYHSNLIQSVFSLIKWHFSHNTEDYITTYNPIFLFLSGSYILNLIVFELLWPL